MLITRISSEPLTSVSIEDFRPSEAVFAWRDIGAWVEFRGTVRRGGKGRIVEAMTYDGHPALVARAMEAVATEVSRTVAQPWSACVLLRLGRVEAGEASVLIATVSAHRAAAYDANRAVLEGLKRSAPIWKCEHFSDGTKAWLDGRSLRESHEDDSP